MNNIVTINRLNTGIPGLDDVLGGGLPEFSFNLIAGPPGCGKTTLAHQMMFALATPQTPSAARPSAWHRISRVTPRPKTSCSTSWAWMAYLATLRTTPSR